MLKKITTTLLLCAGLTFVVPGQASAQCSVMSKSIVPDGQSEGRLTIYWDVRCTEISASAGYRYEEVDVLGLSGVQELRGYFLADGGWTFSVDVSAPKYSASVWAEDKDGRVYSNVVTIDSPFIAIPTPTTVSPDTTVFVTTTTDSPVFVTTTTDSPVSTIQETTTPWESTTTSTTSTTSTTTIAPSTTVPVISEPTTTMLQTTTTTIVQPNIPLVLMKKQYATSKFAKNKVVLKNKKSTLNQYTKNPATSLRK